MSEIQPPTAEKILAALSHVEDPDLKRDLVTLGMIKDLVITPGVVAFTVELTTPACPMKDAIHQACVNAVKHLVDQSLEVQVKMTARTTTNTAGQGLALPGVKNIIGVASGKGGVGKSTIAANLAVGLAESGARVGLLDADIYGPSVPMMFGATRANAPEIFERDGKNIIRPLMLHGVLVMSIGLLMDENQAVAWRGPMATSALKQFINDVEWGELDYLIVDLPPGTGDVHITLLTSLPVRGVVLVTTPQPVALADAKKAASMLRIPQLNTPILGVVENMAWFTPAELPEHRYFLFGEGGGAELAKALEVPLLAQVPLVQSVRESGDKGKPALLTAEVNPATVALRKMAGEVARQVSILNAMPSSPATTELNSPQVV